MTYDNGKVYDHTIVIIRYICSSCGHTHAILPPVIIPYSSFSFDFTISIVYDYLVGKFNSVEAMYKHYGIAISSFYRLLKKFKERKKLWLGLLDDKLNSSMDLYRNLKIVLSLKLKLSLLNSLNKMEYLLPIPFKGYAKFLPYSF